MTDFNNLREKCISLAKKKLKESIGDDTFIIQVTSSIEELDKIINQLATRTREWYAWYNPEFTREMTSNEKFVELITRKQKKELLKEIGRKESMGKDLTGDDLAAIKEIAEKTKSLIEAREKEKQYLEKIMQRHCPNFKAILGTNIGAKIIKHAGSLRSIAMQPATVIQIMGAEKALFKHLSGKARSPKYGIIFNHELMGKVRGKNKGKMARAIADKAALAARIDFFKGEFAGNKMRQQLDKKASQL